MGYAANQIEARNTADKQSASNSNPEMISETVFQLVGGMLMSSKIKQRSPRIFLHLVRTMDKHYSASTIAHEAKLYEERLGSEREFSEATYFVNKSRTCFQNTNSTTNAASRIGRLKSHGNMLSEKKFENLKTQSRVCFSFAKGKPCFYQPCPFQHQEAHVANQAYDDDWSSSDEMDFQSDLLA